MRAATWFSILGALLAMTTLCADTYVLPKLFLFSAGVVSMWSVDARRRHEILAADKAVIAGLAVVFVSTALSTDWRLNIFGTYRSHAASCLVFTLCACAYFAAKESDTEDVSAAMVVGGMILAIYAIIQKRADFVAVPLPSGRVISAIGSPPFLGCVLAVCLPFAAKTRRPILIIPMIVAIALTESRAAYLGAAAGLGFLWFEAGGIFAAVLLLLGVAAALALNRSEGDVMRIDTWRAAIEIFKHHPWLGVGPAGFEDAFWLVRPFSWVRTAGGVLIAQDNAHNDFFQALSTTGALGYLAYVAFLIAAGFRLAGRKEARPALAALAAACVYAKFDPVPFAALAVLAVILGSFCRGEASDGDENPLRWLVGVTASAACLWAALLMFCAEINYTRALKAFSVGSIKGVEYMSLALDGPAREPVYTVEAIESLWELWQMGRKSALHETVLLARDAVDSHPGNAQLQEALVVTMVLEIVHAWPYGTKDPHAYFEYERAMLEVNKSIAMNPLSLQTREAQAQLCSHFHERACFKVAAAEVYRIVKLGFRDHLPAPVCKLCHRAWVLH